jgi:hypothetical protein
MKSRLKYLPNKDVLLLIREQIAAGRSVRLPVKGNSMSPVLLDRRDTVLLHPVDPLKIKVGDVILYSWKDGFLMHRVVGMKPGLQAVTTEGTDTGLQAVTTEGADTGLQAVTTEGADTGLQEGADEGRSAVGSDREEPVKWFICRGDALQTSENVPIENVIALAELPAHSALTLLMRRLWGWVRKASGRLRKRVQRTHCSFGS